MARWETDVKGDFTQLSFGISEESVLMKSEQETEKIRERFRTLCPNTDAKRELSLIACGTSFTRRL